MQGHPDPLTLSALHAAGLVGGPDSLLDPAARLVAHELRRRGRSVIPVRTSMVEGVATPDAVVDGGPTEIKVLREPTINAVAQGLRRGRAQARSLIIDGRGVDLPGAVAHEGLAEAIRKYGDDLDQVMILCREVDIHWP